MGSLSAREWTRSTPERPGRSQPSPFARRPIRICLPTIHGGCSKSSGERKGFPLASLRYSGKYNTPPLHTDITVTPSAVSCGRSRPASFCRRKETYMPGVGQIAAADGIPFFMHRGRPSHPLSVLRGLFLGGNGRTRHHRCWPEIWASELATAAGSCGPVHGIG